ncbi:MAG: hypothetical protein D6770_07525 [Anaerolineae bacterium]|nr:MAG: hypothetical protein D6770_07525 [Anaerolineae bacterium]
MPTWALSLVFWLHLLATVLWIGGLGALSLLVLPAARRNLSLEKQVALLDAIQRRLDPLAWFSLAVLVMTGLFQMSANPNYQGFLVIRGSWAVAILLKHIFVGGMVVVGAFQTWGVLPALRRAILLQQAQGRTDDLGALHRRQEVLLQLNLLLAVIVLALTALARAS